MPVSKVNQPSPLSPDITLADLEFQKHFMSMDMQHEHEMQIALLGARRSLITTIIDRLPTGTEIKAQEIADQVEVLLGIEPFDSDEEAYYANIPNDPTVN